MPDARQLCRVQVVKGRARWGARLVDVPDVWYVGRSPAEAVGRLLIDHQAALAVRITGYAPEGERFIPAADPAMHGQLAAFLQEIVQAGSIPPLWTVGPRGRDLYFSSHPNQDKRILRDAQ